MIKLVAVAFLVAIVSAAQAMPRAVIQQPDSLVTTVREACGAGMHRVNGVCVRMPLGVKQPGALQDYATSAAAASDNRPQVFGPPALRLDA